jgi:hypothetical protein
MIDPLAARAARLGGPVTYCVEHGAPWYGDACENVLALRPQDVARGYEPCRPDLAHDASCHLPGGHLAPAVR